MSHDPHYNKNRHRKWSDKVLSRADFECEECKRYGRLDKDGLPPAAVHAHHIIPVKVRPDLAYKVENGKALCLSCHNQKHPEKGGYRGRF